MNQNLKIFLGVFLLSLPFWWTLNIFSQYTEDFFLFSELAQNPQIFTAQAALEARVQEVLPLKKWGAVSLQLDSASALTVFVNAKSIMHYCCNQKPPSQHPEIVIQQRFQFFLPRLKPLLFCQINAVQLPDQSYYH